MIELVKQEIMKHGDKASIVPVSRLQDIRKDIEDLENRESLNAFQEHIVNNLYVTDLPDVDFEVCSIIIVASPSPASVGMTFAWEGERIPLSIPAAYIDGTSAPAGIEQYLNEFLSPKGHHVKHAPRLPRKLLAVRSGLGAYGRNNICYVEGMGSFLNLAPYFSDIPCVEECWQDIRQMDVCEGCKACLNNCPTQAITDTRFLIDNERCLTYFNEADGETDFPEWIDPSWHNSVYGCSRCQAVCPANKKYLDNIAEPVEFSEEETLLLLEGKPLDQFPQDLEQKVRDLDMVWCLGALPRNLRVLFDREIQRDA